MVKFKDRSELLGPDIDFDEYVEPVNRVRCDICQKMFLARQSRWLKVCEDSACLAKMSQHYRFKSKMEHKPEPAY